MKTPLLIAAFCFSLSLTLQGQTARPTAAATIEPGAKGQRKETPYVVTARDANSRVWERTEYETAPDGTQIPHLHKYTELATGLHFKNGKGEWEESKEEFELLPGSAVARQGQHKVTLNYNLNSAGAVELEMPDGRKLKSHVLGLSYYDPASGKSVLIAEVKDSVGKVAGNQVIYEDAFTDFKADVRYTYRKSSFEQDIILREQPPTPEAYGLDAATTRLQVLTEFIQAPEPKAIKTKHASKRADGANVEREENDLDFGSMAIRRGKAFELGAENSRDTIPVNKEFLTLEGRKILVEEVSMLSVQPRLKALALAKPSRNAKAFQGATIESILPKAPVARVSRQTMDVAQSAPAPDGFVVDYVFVNTFNSGDYVFQADTTYYVSSYADFSSCSTVTFEGGTVVKFSTSSSISCYSGPILIFQSDSYRPVVFTSQDDSSVGEPVAAGTPSGYYGSLDFPPGDYMHDLRLSHMYIVGLDWDGKIENIQATDCYSISSGGNDLTINNGLLRNVQNIAAYWDEYSTVHGTHLTIQNCGSLQGWTDLGTCALTNCLLVSVTNLSASLATNCVSILTNASGVFQSVGGGANYLANGTYRNLGTTNIDPMVLANIRKKTTYPPTAYTNVTFTNAQTFGPQNIRDTDAPDLGYHYDALDYAFGGCTANSNVTFSAGAAIGWFRTSSGWMHAGHGIHIADDTVAAFNGTVSAPTYWVRLNTVQEQDITAGYGPGGISSWADVGHFPTIRARFLKGSVLANDLGNFFRGDYGGLILQTTDCEFWSGGMGDYGAITGHTNCLFYRTSVGRENQDPFPSIILRNCTFSRGLADFQPSIWRQLVFEHSRLCV